MTPNRASLAPRARLAAARAADWFVVGTVAIALAAGVTVSLGIHRPWTTLPLAVAIGWGLWKAVGPRAEASRDDVRAGKYSLAGLAAWIVVGLIFSSEYLVVTRDPGFLTLTGVWLTDHPSTDIPTRGAIEAAAQQSNALADAWQAWNLSGDVIQPQGAKMLPGVLAVGGWIAGVPGVLAANVFVGAAGIAAVYLVARRLMGPLAAMAPAALLGLTVSHLGLSRSSYSEPLTLVLIVASVAWAWRGIEERRPWALVAAGVASGSTALVRIDGGAYALGVLVGVAAVCLLRGTRLPLVFFSLAQAPMVGAGYWSLHRWSEAYLERLGGEARTVAFGYAGVVVLLLLASVIAGAGWARRLVALARTRRETLAGWAAGTTAFAVVILALRPVYMTDRRGTESSVDQFTTKVVGGFQQSEGYPLDPTRTYAEHTVTWLSYYLTWPILALATVGLGVLVWRAVMGRPSILVLLAALAVPTAVYLVRPAIVPDQLWAIRRFEPATLPLLAVAAAVGAWWVAAKLGERYPDRTRAVTAAAAALMVAAPVSTYLNVRWGDDYPLAIATYTYQREQVGARAQIDDLCEIIDGRPVVLTGSSGYFGSIRVMCDVPVVLALTAPDPDSLALIAEIFGEQPVVLTRDATLLWDEAPAPVVDSITKQGELALQRMPRMHSEAHSLWYAGVVEPDGSVTPIAPPS